MAGVLGLMEIILGHAAAVYLPTGCNLIGDSNLLATCYLL